MNSTVTTGELLLDKDNTELGPDDLGSPLCNSNQKEGVHRTKRKRKRRRKGENFSSLLLLGSTFAWEKEKAFLGMGEGNH